ncbi:MAG TPA: Clp protease N-terminal domain-containing protein [Abditibacteriaceae bacterium]|nr:Clp protease N-terminal domain-containing protein [Abditibacteriaceae bacterium]
MWQRFTERARRVILLGQEEAARMQSGHVGTEHLLLGLIREGEGVASQVLQKMDVSAERVRQEIATEAQPPSTASESIDPSAALGTLSATLRELGAHFKLSREQVRQIEEQTLRQLRKGSASTPGEPKLTPTSKRVLELAAEEARRMRHNYIGTEHLLLALLREKDDVAAGVLHRLGLSLEDTRRQVMEYLRPGEPAQEKPGGKSGSGGQYSAEQSRLVEELGELIQIVKAAVDAMASSGKAKKDKLEVVNQKLEELKNKHQEFGAGNSAQNSSEN